MKKLIATVCAIAGGILVLWAGVCILGTKQHIFGYDAMYPGLLGLALLSYGLITRGE
jgi:hypothetical protein